MITSIRQRSVERQDIVEGAVYSLLSLVLEDTSEKVLYSLDHGQNAKHESSTCLPAAVKTSDEKGDIPPAWQPQLTGQPLRSIAERVPAQRSSYGG